MAMPGVTRPSSPDETLRSRVGQGVRWSLANTVLSRVVSLGAGILLARILDPKDYGVYAVAMVVLTALLSMNELGVSLAVVRWPGDVGRIAPTVAKSAVGVSALLYVLAYALAPAFASTLNAPGAAPMIRLLSVCILVDAVAAVPAGLITREFQQRRRLVIDLAGFASGTALTIVLALSWGTRSMEPALGFRGLECHRGRDVRRAGAHVVWSSGSDAGVARDLLAFGLPLAGSSGVLFLLMNLDYVVVGRLLGATSLGFDISARIQRVLLARESHLDGDAACDAGRILPSSREPRGCGRGVQEGRCHGPDGRAAHGCPSGRVRRAPRRYCLWRQVGALRRSVALSCHLGRHSDSCRPSLRFLGGGWPQPRQPHTAVTLAACRPSCAHCGRSPDGHHGSGHWSRRRSGRGHRAGNGAHRSPVWNSRHAAGSRLRAPTARCCRHGRRGRRSHSLGLELVARDARGWRVVFSRLRAGCLAGPSRPSRNRGGRTRKPLWRRGLRPNPERTVVHPSSGPGEVTAAQNLMWLRWRCYR